MTQIPGWSLTAPAQRRRALRRAVIITSVPLVAMSGTLLASSAVAGTGMQPTVARAAAPTADAALATLGACMVQQHAGQVVLLIDESGSLKSTDSTSTRVTAARYLVDNLARFARDAKVSLQMRVAGFDTTYHPAGSWESLPAGLPAVESTVAGFAEKNSGFETDYWTALDGARRDLASVAKPVDGQPGCQAIIWFSDGKYELDYRKTPEEVAKYGTTKPYSPNVELTTEQAKVLAEQKGRDSLCRPAQLADSIRSAGIVTLAVGLAPPGTPAAQFDFMKSIAQGSSTGQTCGKPLTSTQPSPGSFYLARNVDGIVFAFDAISDPTQQPVLDQAGRVCANASASCKKVEFVLDDSIGKVHILAGADDPGVNVVLTAPGNKAQTFTSGNGATSGNVVASWVTGQTLSLDLQRPAAGGAGWAGVWSVTFVSADGKPSSALSRTQIRIVGDLVPAWPAATTAELRSGADPASLSFRIETEENGTQIPPAAIKGTADFNATLIEADGTQVPIAVDQKQAALDGSFPLSLKGATPGPATLRLGLTVTTAPYEQQAGTTLSPRVVDYAVTVLPPLNFPTAAGSVTFAQTDGTGPIESSVDVTGPGCVWLDTTNVTAAPDEASPVTITSPASSAATCVHLAAGETKQLPLELTAAHVGNGAVAGSVVLALAADNDPSKHVASPVRFSGELERPADTARLAGAFILALLVGLGLPPLFLLGLKWWTARIPPGGGLWLTTMDLVVSPASVRGGDGAPVEAAAGERHFLAIDADGQRELALPGTGVVVHAHTGWNPASVPVALAEAVDGRALVSGVAPHQDGSKRAVLPLALHNHWIAWLGDGDAPEDARPVAVLVLASGLASVEVFARITSDIVDVLPSLLPLLVAAESDDARVAAPVGATDEWGSAGQASSLGGTDDFGPASGSGSLGGSDDW